LLNRTVNADQKFLDFFGGFTAVSVIDVSGASGSLARIGCNPDGAESLGPVIHVLDLGGFPNAVSHDM
jgi:hypothetical protein